MRLSRFSEFKTCGVLAIMLLSTTSYVCAQNTVDEFRRLMNQSYEEFSKQAQADYVSFRAHVNQEYAEFMRSHPWIPTDVKVPLLSPIKKETAPDITQNDDSEPQKNEYRVKIEEVVAVDEPSPKPEPIEPIEEILGNYDNIQLQFYGTPVIFRNVDLDTFRLVGDDEKAFADGWGKLSQQSTNNLLVDCLKIRDELLLPDWGYIKLLELVASYLLGENTNEQRLLQGFLLNQSGYKVRFAYDGQRNLHVLFASSGLIYGHLRYNLGGEWYYSYTQPVGDQVYICKFEMPGERAMDPAINVSPNLKYMSATPRNIEVNSYPDVMLSVAPNKNLIDFFNDYPSATLDMSPYTMWAIHGNTPVSKEIKTQLYPSLRNAVAGKNQYEALQFLLKVAQSFPYGYDETIWGKDRTFWMEESWAYPYSDCEDHAINFSHMVRDILGLDVCLVYYPGHLSSCVEVTDEDINGDYIIYDDKKYIICDPTYFYSSVGKTAPSNNNSEAILIPLRKLD